MNSSRSLVHENCLRIANLLFMEVNRFGLENQEPINVCNKCIMYQLKVDVDKLNAVKVVVN